MGVDFRALDRWHTRWHDVCTGAQSVQDLVAGICSLAGVMDLVLLQHNLDGGLGENEDRYAGATSAVIMLVIVASVHYLCNMQKPI